MYLLQVFFFWLVVFLSFNIYNTRMPNTEFGQISLCFGKCRTDFAHKSILRHKNIKWYCRSNSHPLRINKKGTNDTNKIYVIEEELLSHVFLVNTVIRFCVSYPFVGSFSEYTANTHSYFVSIYIFIYKSFMFDGFLASSSAHFILSNSRYISVWLSMCYFTNILYYA